MLPIALPWWGFAIISAMLGGGVGWWMWNRLKRAEADAIELNARKAAEKQDAEISSIEREVRKSVSEEMKREGPPTVDEWRF